MKVQSLFRKFLAERRAATAVVLALTIVPLIIAAGAAVDFARLSSSRAQLQAAVDGAAIAGVGAYANDESGTNAITVAKAAFNASFASMANAIALNTATSPGVTAGCTSTTAALCGTGYTTMSSTACSAGTYCVTVAATATQRNSLFYRLFSENISVKGTAQYTVPSGSPPGQTISYNNLDESYMSNGGNQFNNPFYSGVGAGTLDTVSNAAGYDPVVFFLDGINTQLPPSTISYASVKPPGGLPQCGGAPPTITTVAIEFYSVPGGTYCGGLTLGNPPTQSSYYIAGSEAFPLNIVNGNMTVAPATFICPEIMNNYSYSGAGVNIVDSCESAGDNPSAGNYTPIYLSQTTTGSGALVLSYHFNVTPSVDNSGLLTFVSNDSGIESSASSGFQAWYPAPICPGAVSTCTTGSIQATAPVYSGTGTIYYEATTISTITIQDGEPYAWTQQNITAVKFDSTQGVQEDTQIAQLGGTYNTSGAPVVKDSATNTSTTTFTPSSYATGNATGDAYAQLNATCTAANTAGKIGGTGAIGDTVGQAPSTPTVAPISVGGATDLFALTTAMPPSATPPVAYNFTDPNYGYSEITSFFRGTDLLTQTVYFCGNGNQLTVTAGNASGLTVGSGSSGGSVLTN
jgi:Flp pilus assembly protein TadG